MLSVLTSSQVPPIIIMMTKSKELLAKYDLSSVNAILTGAAPLGEETAEELHRMYPKWAVRQAYGRGFDLLMDLLLTALVRVDRNFNCSLCYEADRRLVRLFGFASARFRVQARVIGG